MAPTASPLVHVGIPLVAALVAVLMVLGARRVDGPRGAVRFAAILGAWALLAALLSLSGALAQWESRPPPLVPFFAGTLALGFVVGLSSLGARLATLPLPALVGFHAFRLPLELVMHEAWSEGVMPVQMTYTGWNFDILTGLSAIVLALVLRRRALARPLVLAWNAVGSALLTGIGAIAVLSTPVFHAFGTRPQDLNTWAAYFPFVYIAFAVFGALVGHVVIFRKLLASRASATARVL